MEHNSVLSNASTTDADNTLSFFALIFTVMVDGVKQQVQNILSHSFTLLNTVTF